MNSYQWSAKDYSQPSPNSPTVYSACSGAGGSVYGYSLADYKLIGACDIDNKAKEVFLANHVLNENCFHHLPLKRLIQKQKIIDQIKEYNIDILDISPSAPSFSSIKNCTIKEPQDLIMDSVELTRKLNPKVLVIQTESFISQARYKDYVKIIFKKLNAMGYSTQLFIMDSVDFDVAQKREMAFIISTNLLVPKLIPPQATSAKNKITCKQAFAHLPSPLPLNDDAYQSHDLINRYHALTKKGSSLSAVFREFRNTQAFGSWIKIDDGSPCFTLTTTPLLIHYDEPRFLTLDEYKAASSFPTDFSAPDEQLGKYFLGQATPPFLMKAIAEEIKDQWLNPTQPNSHLI